MSVPISAPSSGSGSATTVAAAVPAPYRRTIFFAVILGANLQVLDTTMATVEQVKAFAKGGSARIQR